MSSEKPAPVAKPVERAKPIKPDDKHFVVSVAGVDVKFRNGSRYGVVFDHLARLSNVPATWDWLEAMGPPPSKEALVRMLVFAGDLWREVEADPRWRPIDQKGKVTIMSVLCGQWSAINKGLVPNRNCSWLSRAGLLVRPFPCRGVQDALVLLREHDMKAVDDLMEECCSWLSRAGLLVRPRSRADRANIDDG